MGTWVSIIGLSSLFAGSSLVIALAICLDFAKVISISFLYKHWAKVNLLMKGYMSIAAIVLMMITSAGAFGFLSSEFQKAISSTNQDTVLLSAMTDEQGRLQTRKEEIDAQISKLPDNMVVGRRALMKQFAPEVEKINSRLATIDKDLPALKVTSIKKGVEVGPIIYIAEAFNTTPEKAVKWVIFTIIFVFDPLAIALLLAGNYLLEDRKKNPLPKKNLEVFDLQKHAETAATAENPVMKAFIDAQVNLPPEDNIKDLPIITTEKVLPTPQHHSEETIEEEVTPTVDTFSEEVIESLAPEKIDPLKHLDADQLHLHLGRERPLDNLDEEVFDAAREVITLKQVAPTKPIRSSLENMVSGSDVIINEIGLRNQAMANTVTVGGPSDRISR